MAAEKKERVIQKEVLLPHNIEDVWTALTDPKALAEWLMPNNFKPEVGHKFQFRVDPVKGFYSGIQQCEVLEVTKPSRLVYSWTVVPAKNETPWPPPMLLTWTLEAQGNSTRLRLHQTGAESLNWWWRFSMSTGWNRMLKSLLPKVLSRVHSGRFTPGAATRRDYGTKTVPEDFAK